MKGAMDSQQAKKKKVCRTVLHSYFLKWVYVRGVFLFSNEKLDDGWYLFSSENTARPGTDIEKEQPTIGKCNWRGLYRRTKLRPCHSVWGKIVDSMIVKM